MTKKVYSSRFGLSYECKTAGLLSCLYCIFKTLCEKRFKTVTATTALVAVEVASVIPAVLAGITDLESETTEEVVVTTEAVAETTEAVVETTEAVAVTTEAVAETTEAVAEATVAAPETTEAVAEIMGIVVEITHRAVDMTVTAGSKHHLSFVI